MAVSALQMETTTERSRVRHRLALGVQWIDAVAQLPAVAAPPAAWRCELEAVAGRPLKLPFEGHTQGRHALRHDGRFRRWLEHAVAEGDALDCHLRGHGLRDARHPYTPANDPRVHVPRRLSLLPAMADGAPLASMANARTVWLWPGAAYPLPATATAVRGRLMRDMGAGRTAPIPWARLLITRPGNGAPNVATEVPLAWAHGDDRGEFVAVLGASAVPGGAALPAQVAVHLWVWLPPAATPFDPADPLASLPLENGGADALNAVLKGQAPPPGYVLQTVRPLPLSWGQVRSVADAELLFA